MCHCASPVWPSFRRALRLHLPRMAIARKHLGDIFGEASRRRVGGGGEGDERGGESRDEACEPCRHAACLLAECLVDAGEFHEAGRVFDALRAIDPVRANYHAFRRAHALGLVSA